MLLLKFLKGATIVAAFEGPQSLDELTSLVFAPDAPPFFVELPSFSHVAVASNDTAILQVRDLTVSHYPIKHGHITFKLDHILNQDIPKDSRMEIVSYVGNKLLFNGTLPVCDYLKFAKLECPVKKHKKPEISRQLLLVPDDAKDGRLGFVAKVTTPENELVLHIAGLIDLVDDGTIAEEELEVTTRHDEL